MLNKHLLQVGVVGRSAALVCVAALLLLGAAGCGGSSDDSDSASGEASKVGVLFDGPKDDGGYNTTWVEAAAGLEQEIPGTEVTLVDNVSPGAATQRAATTLATDGHDLIVATGAGQDADLAKVAARFPDVEFVGAFGTKFEPNLGEVSMAIEQGRYLDGIVAGSVTKSDVIGYVAGFPIPIVDRGIDALAQGVKSVNPDATIRPLYINSWYDPAKERQAAQALIDEGADVLAMDSNTPAVATVAEENGTGVIGYAVSREHSAPEQWLTSFTVDWTPYLTQWVKDIEGGSWASELYYEGLATGVIGLAPFGPRVTEEVQGEVDQAREQIIAGDLDVFSGPIEDDEGEVVVPDGSAITDSDELNECCTWLADNVDGG